MKRRNKIIGALAAVLLIGTAICGAWSYLNYTSVKEANVFTVKKLDFTLDEAKVDQYGRAVDAKGQVVENLAEAARIKGEEAITAGSPGNQYPLAPGQAYVKDPTVTILKHSPECYVRMKVEVNSFDKLKAIFAPGDDSSFDLETVFLGYNSAWQRQSIVTDPAADTVTYEYWYEETVGGRTDASGNAVDNALPSLFTSVKIPDTVTAEQLQTLTAGFNITVTADVIQASKNFADATEAWAKYDGVDGG